MHLIDSSLLPTLGYETSQEHRGVAGKIQARIIEFYRQGDNDGGTSVAN